MLNGQYVGCTTGFSQSDKTDIFIPNQKVDATATPYLQRLVAVDLIKVEQTGEPEPIAPPLIVGEPIVVDGVYPEPLICVPQSSGWSRPITWEMVNKPAQNGGVTVHFGETNYWIDLRTIQTIDLRIWLANLRVVAALILTLARMMTALFRCNMFLLL